jgi:hypothetical protein
VPLGVVCLIKIVALNRRYQDEARAAVLVARWGGFLARCGGG